MADQEDRNGANPERDPVEFLFTNTKYHDCQLTVGNPDVDDVEKIGVSSTHLIAHSSVFRDMLADSPLADPSGDNTHIKDVSPATFKLMLRHVYGGKLPKMTSQEAAELAFCADKYNISRLLGKATKRLKPTDVDDFFFALKVFIYIKCQNLETDLTKFVQQKTDEIVQNPKFLELYENEILFIVKQNTLNITEVEVWKNVVRWAENQVKNNPDKNTRGVLGEILPHVRLLVFSVEEITNHVLPIKIFNEKEAVDLIMARISNKGIKVPGLCDSQEKRTFYKNEIIVKANKCSASLKKRVNIACSTVTIEPLRKLQISTVTMRSLSHNLICDIEIYESACGIARNRRVVTLRETVIPNQLVTLQVRDCGKPLIFEANTVYLLKVTPSPPLPSYEIKSYDGSIKRFPIYSDCSDIEVSFNDPFHIVEFAFKAVE